MSGRERRGLSERNARKVNIKREWQEVYVTVGREEGGEDKMEEFGGHVGVAAEGRKEERAQITEEEERKWKARRKGNAEGYVGQVRKEGFGGHEVSGDGEGGGEGVEEVSVRSCPSQTRSGGPRHTGNYSRA